jgi:nucleoside-diphosphate-sugar epimerase
MIDTQEYREDLQQILSKDYPWERLARRTILVTGASGMIGSLLTDVLVNKARQHGFKVIAMARHGDKLEQLFGNSDKNLQLLQHNVIEPFELKCDFAFHCASNTHPLLYSTDPVGTITTNVLGLKNVIKSLTGKGRLICLSSVEIYGENRGDVEFFDEDYCGYIDPNTVRSGYNESKRLCESLCQAYRSQYGLDFVTARLSRAYGPSLRLDDTKALSQMISNACKGEDIVLKSEGAQRYSYCYSADAVDALLYLLFNGVNGEAYNISSKDSDITLKELAETAAAIAGTKVRYELPNSVEEKGYSIATLALLDTKKIKEIGWESHFPLSEGLKRTISSIKANLL